MAIPRTGGSFWTIALIAVPLFAILGGAGWFAVSAWTSISGPAIPPTGYVAMAIGVIFSVVVGSGLMALLFYSNRYGYDEPPQQETRRDE